MKKITLMVLENQHISKFCQKVSTIFIKTLSVSLDLDFSGGRERVYWEHMG